MIARCGFAQLTERPRNPAFKDVPEGHQNSELSDASCNVGLTRRKDLTLRTDIFLAIDGEKVGLPHLLKVGWERRVALGFMQHVSTSLALLVVDRGSAAGKRASTMTDPAPLTFTLSGNPEKSTA